MAPDSVKAAPQILPEELSTFHAAHFGTLSTDHFATNFLGPVDDTEQLEEDDGLGYYEDGVKRTLTDEQIAIFRHSEVETLLRERRHAAEATEDHTTSSHPNASPKAMEGSIIGPVQPAIGTIDQDVDDGEVHDAVTPATSTTSIDGATQAKSKRKKKSKNPGVRNLHKKPDLRKRTWDVVERDTMNAGMDYGDAPASDPRAGSTAPKRRMVSYDDV